MQINRSEANWERSEKPVNGAFLDNVLTSTITTTELAILGFNMKNYRSSFVFCFQVLLIGQPESMMQQTCTHRTSDLSYKYIYKYALL